MTEPERAIAFVNGNCDAAMDIEKKMDGASDEIFVMNLKQVISIRKNPVTKPAARPAIKAKNRATNTFTPLIRRIEHTAAPVQKEPSTVKSAISKILKVMYTPTAIIPHIKPCATAPGIALIRSMINYSLLNFFVSVGNCNVEFLTDSPVVFWISFCIFDRHFGNLFFAFKNLCSHFSCCNA